MTIKKQKQWHFQLPEGEDTVYIVDDHSLVGDPSLEWYNVTEFKKLVEYFEKLYWTKDSRYQQQNIHVFWNKEDAENYREKLKEIWDARHKQRDQS
tara:strand:+ start:43 stop:330 length:288 start_codon:yes stop_codon:yes gene_type:complete